MLACDQPTLTRDQKAKAGSDSATTATLITFSGIWIKSTIFSLKSRNILLDNCFRAMARADCPTSSSRRGFRLPLPNVWLGVSVENQTTADWGYWCGKFPYLAKPKELKQDSRAANQNQIQ